MLASHEHKSIGLKLSRDTFRSNLVRDIQEFCIHLSVLYSGDSSHSQAENPFEGLSVPTLSDPQKSPLEPSITFNLQAIKTLKFHNILGPDGLLAPYYKIFANLRPTSYHHL